MSIDESHEAPKPRHRDPWRSRYRFSAEQVAKMVEHRILPEGRTFELRDGILYRMTGGELHNLITGAIAKAIRRVTMAGYHVCEEKSCLSDAMSVFVPDVAVCRGGTSDDLPKLPELSKLALVVEVDPSTKPSEQDDRHRRYAEVRIPVYWQVGAEDRLVSVYRKPEGAGETARYKTRESYGMTREIPIVIDDREVGRVAVADFFPVDPTEAGT